jgi:hypothetical protein
VKLAEAFRNEALRAIEAQLALFKDTLHLAAAALLPQAQSRDIVLVGREAQLTIFRQMDRPLPGHVLVTVQVARHSLGGVSTLRFEKGLVYSPGDLVREATDQELQASG